MVKTRITTPISNGSVEIIRNMYELQKIIIGFEKIAFTCFYIFPFVV